MDKLLRAVAESNDPAALATMLQHHGALYLLHKHVYVAVKTKLTSLLCQGTGRDTDGLKLLTIKALSERTGIPAYTLREEYRAGRLKIIRTPAIRVTEADAIEWLQSRRRQT